MITADALARMPDDGNRYELIRGELRVMSPAGGRHGRIAWRLAMLLGNHVDQNALGVVYAAETGFLVERDPDTVAAPDVAFVAAARAKQLDQDVGYVPFAPDLAGEIISPSDTFSDVEAKAFRWLAAGTGAVLLVEPESRSVHLYRSRKDISISGESESVDLSDVVSGWRFAVADLFR